MHMNKFLQAATLCMQHNDETKYASLTSYFIHTLTFDLEPTLWHFQGHERTRCIPKA